MIVTGLIIPRILLVAFRKNLFDNPDPRKIHTAPVPRLGGIAFLPSILFSELLVLGSVSIMEGLTGVYHIPVNFRAISMGGCAMLIMYITGLADDLVGVRYRAKFFAQIISGLFLYVGGLTLNDFHTFLWINELPVFIQILFTVFITVFVTNAINLIDGIDGLASGLSSLAFMFYGIIFFDQGLYYYSFLCFSALGAMVTFFYYNVFGNAGRHKKIFMGDTGALTIGLFLCIFSLRINMLTSLEDKVNPAAAAFVPLLIPCFDVVRVFCRRIIKKRHPFMPDKSHIHHKLMALGLHRQLIMPVIIIFGAGIILLSYWLSSYLNVTFIFLIDLALWLIFNFILTRLIRRRETALNQILYP